MKWIVTGRRRPRWVQDEDGRRRLVTDPERHTVEAAEMIITDGCLVFKRKMQPGNGVTAWLEPFMVFNRDQWATAVVVRGDEKEEVE